MEERRKQLLCAIVVMAMMVFWAADAKKVHIPDELDDVVDDEEDEEWKAWGKPKPKDPPPFDPPPDDLSSLSPFQIQEEMLKRHMGTAMGFVKLRLDVRRSKDEITRIAEKWTKLLRTGSISAKIMAVDVNTIMFIIEDGQSISEGQKLQNRVPQFCIGALLLGNITTKFLGPTLSFAWIGDFHVPFPLVMDLLELFGGF